MEFSLFPEMKTKVPLRESKFGFLNLSFVVYPGLLILAGAFSSVLQLPCKAGGSHSTTVKGVSGEDGVG